MKDRLDSTLPIRAFHLFIMATALSSSVVMWQLSFHVAFTREVESMTMFGHLIHVVGDTALLLPLALFVIAVGLIFSARIGLDSGNWHGIVGSASIISILFFLGAVPGVSIHGYSHGYADRIVEGFSGTSPVNLDDSVEVDLLATKSNLSEPGFHGLHDAAVSQIVVLPMTILGVLLLSKSGNLPIGVRRREPRE